ncbi:hypothetical protein JGI10_00302 [Candidatus Kryptonium thompsonii]|nr:hypothetical protein JGI10_00302 [Candidatus Kryptonium thompsoni]
MNDEVEISKIKERILKFLKKRSKRSFRLKEIARKLGLMEEYEMDVIRRVLMEMVERGEVIKLPRNTRKTNRTAQIPPIQNIRWI